MMARRSAMASIMLSLSALLTPTLAARWTVTSWYVVEVTTSTYSTYTDDFAKYTYTATETVKPDFKPTATEALDVQTSFVTYDDLEIVQIYLPKTDVPKSEVQTTYSYHTGPYTYYVQPEVWTAPKSCPTPFTVTTWQLVDIPSEVVDQYTPRTIETSSSIYAGSRVYDITAYLTERVSSGDVKTDYYYTNYVEQCINPTASRDYYGGGGSSGGSSSGDDDDYSWGGLCHHGYGAGCALKIWIIVVVSVIPALFLFGFIENYFWFRRLMLGKGTLRFGTICWICLSLLVLCFTRSVPSRSPEDRQKLKEAWANVSGGQRIKLWFKYGFRHRYPVELLGEHPNWRNGRQGPLAPMGGPNGGPGPAGPNQGQGGWVYYTTENGQVQSQWYQDPQTIPGQQGTQVTYYPPSQQTGYPQQGQLPPQAYYTGQPAPFGYPPLSPQSPSHEMSTATPTPHLSHVSAVVGEKSVSTPSPVPQMGYPPPPAQMQGTGPQEIGTAQAPTEPSELGGGVEHAPHVEGRPEDKPEPRS